MRLYNLNQEKKSTTNKYLKVYNNIQKIYSKKQIYKLILIIIKL